MQSKFVNANNLTDLSLDACRSPDMAAMHQDTSEDREVVSEKLKEVFGVRTFIT